MMETVLGLFVRFEDANRTVRILQESGFSEEGVSIFSREEILLDEEKTGASCAEASGSMESESGCAKDLLGALASLVISDQKVKIFSDGVKQGGALVIARATNSKANAVKMIMSRQHATEIQRIFPSIMGRAAAESEESDSYYPLLWHQLHEA
jgi:hypothetical protein